MSKNYPLNYDLTKSFISISESFSKLNFDTKSFMGIKDSLTKSIISMSESFSKLNYDTKSFMGIKDSLTKSFISMSESFSKLNYDTKSFMDIKDSLTKSFISMSESFSKLNYDTIAKSFTGINKNLNSLYGDWSIDNVENEKIVEENIIELQNDFESINVKINWQQCIIAVITKWKEKNPVIASIIFFLFLAFLTGIIQSFGETVKSAIMYEQPKSESSIILKLDASQEVKIIDIVPYFYEIEINKEDTTITGFVSKRSIRIKQIPEDIVKK